MSCFTCRHCCLGVVYVCGFFIEFCHMPCFPDMIETEGKKPLSTRSGVYIFLLENVVSVKLQFHETKLTSFLIAIGWELLNYLLIIVLSEC